MKNLLSVVTPWLDHGAQVYNAAQRATALWIAVRLRYRYDATGTLRARNDKGA